MVMAIPRLRELQKERVSIPAFYEEDAEAIARKLKLYDDIKSGRTRCFICGCTVTFKNLGAFLKTGDGVKVVCDRAECLAKAVKIAETLRK